MGMDGTVLSLVGATGGAGTTRLSLEVAGTLARTGSSVAVVDAAYATQGLAMTVDGPIDPDVTGAVTGDEPLTAATVDLAVDADGRVVVAPARAPFERLARAKTSESARRLAEGLATAAQRHDAVVVDVPPVGGNQAVAAVTAADRVGVVVPDSQRGMDALAHAIDRLRDVGAPADAVVANRVEGDPVVGVADAEIPPAPEPSLAAAPTSHAGTDEFAVAVAGAAETLVGASPDLDVEESGGLASYLWN
jgi:cellulose biosynthesis protein BcsQ